MLEPILLPVHRSIELLDILSHTFSMAGDRASSRAKIQRFIKKKTHNLGEYALNLSFSSSSMFS